MFMKGKAREQEPHYIPLSLIIITSYQTVCIVQYYNHVLLRRMVVQKKDNFIQFICILP